MARTYREKKMLSMLTSAYRAASVVHPEHIMNAQRKPNGVSDIRWRIELRRRANPDRYAMADLVLI